MKNQDKVANQPHHQRNAPNDTQELTFPDETRHLSNIMLKLDAALADAKESVLRIDQEYREAKQYMADYHSEMDGHEKLQNERMLEPTLELRHASCLIANAENIRSRSLKQ